MFDALRLTGERGMTLQELAHFTHRALPVVAVGVRDLHARGIVERRIIKGIVYWSTNNKRRTHAYH